MTKMLARSQWVYLDNNATTQPDERAIEAMLPFYRGGFANPSSSHALGAMAADAVRVARTQVSALIGAKRVM